MLGNMRFLVHRRGVGAQHLWVPPTLDIRWRCVSKVRTSRCARIDRRCPSIHGCVRPVVEDHIHVGRAQEREHICRRWGPIRPRIGLAARPVGITEDPHECSWSDLVLRLAEPTAPTISARSQPHLRRTFARSLGTVLGCRQRDTGQSSGRFFVWRQNRFRRVARSEAARRPRDFASWETRHLRPRKRTAFARQFRDRVLRLLRRHRRRGRQNRPVPPPRSED